MSDSSSHCIDKSSPLTVMNLEHWWLCSVANMSTEGCPHLWPKNWNRDFFNIHSPYTGDMRDRTSVLMFRLSGMGDGCDRRLKSLDCQQDFMGDTQKAR